jgi:hypothetical protein
VKDILVIAIVIGFFAVCAAYVTWCERVLAADAPDRRSRDAANAGRSARTAEPTNFHSPDAAVVTVGGLNARRQ